MCCAPRPLVAYTDGSCRGNGARDARAGFAVHFPNGELCDIMGSFALGTNQKAELLAIYVALKAVRRAFGSAQPLQLFSDSKYAIQCCTTTLLKWQRNGFRNAKNQRVVNEDTIRKTSALLQEMPHVALRHVAGHSGSRPNARADWLANAAY